MKPQVFEQTIFDILNERLRRLEDHFKADVIFFYGPIGDFLEKPFRDFVEDLKEDSSQRRFVIVLNTPGGSAETVDRLVKIIRYHYDEVYFVVPDSAYSAGTIFCMSGDKIYMDYSSALGPIDPQVNNGKHWVPALGYLDKVAELIAKAQNGTITSAELVLLRDQDLAMLRSFEQARDLTHALLKEWLVKYKFKDWDTHQTTPELLGKKVTESEKEERAQEVARLLSDNSLWHSHGRAIGISQLTRILRLQIDDYSGQDELRNLIRDYNDLITQYIIKEQLPAFLHSRKSS